MRLRRPAIGKEIEHRSAPENALQSHDKAKPSSQSGPADPHQASEAAGPPLLNKVIYLVSSANAQGRLLIDYIAKKTGIRCFLVGQLEKVDPSLAKDNCMLLMRDCYRKSNEMVLAELQFLYQENLADIRTLLPPQKWFFQEAG